jgi:hypothetical protein
MATMSVGAVETRFSTGRLLRLLEAEALLFLSVAGVIGILAAALPKMVVGDTWLALVDGRWIARHGLPHSDQLTVWTRGGRWVDQQWLAHWLLYQTAQLGGMKLTLGLVLVADVTAFAIAVRFVRRGGFSPRSTALAVLLPLVVGPWLFQARTQSLALPFFVTTYALLAHDSRHPSRRVLAVVPLLVLWANLHGSAALGALLIAIHGLLITRRRALEGLALVALAPTALLASPYALDLPRYYRTMLVDSPLRHYVDEWKPTTPSLQTVGFFLAAVAVALLTVKHRKQLSSFERAALPLLVAVGLLAARNTGWLGWGVALSGPALLDAAWCPAPRTNVMPSVNTLVSAGAAVLACALVVGRFAQPTSTLLGAWSPDGARAVAAAAGPKGNVFADELHADWLLWEEPELRGRIAYDIRFELLSRDQLAALERFRRGDGRWKLLAGYRVLTLTSGRDARWFRDRASIAYVSPRFAVLKL